ncbi:MAG: redoxin family protein [Gemmataceae bacterium]|nr:redoxin family protein [Gemmataceae bacterium]
MLTAIGVGAVHADDAAKPLRIGDIAPTLTFKDIRYLPRSLDDFGKKKAYVLVFTTTGCPLVERYLPVLQELETAYRPKDVQFVAINVGLGDSVVTMATQAVEHEMEFPFVKDFEGKWAPALGVQRTPEVVVLNAERRLRYRGRIDDQYRLSGIRAEPTRRDLAAALDEILAGKDVSVPETPVDGCLITRIQAANPKRDVTYAEHIAPILGKHCVVCHQPGTAAPFSLLNYQHAKSRAATIAEVVDDQRMPPWHASPRYGHFVNRRGLSDAERELVGQWARTGAARGDASKAPACPPERQDGWLIGQPELVIRDGTTYTIPKEGIVPYKYAILPHVFDEETWLQAAQILPDNPRVVHHCNMAYVSAAESFKMSNFVTGFVPGGGPLDLKDGIALRIPANSVLVLQIHLVTTGKEEKCRLAVGLKFARGTVKRQLRFHLLADRRFAIPPGAPAHPVQASRVLDADVIGVGLFAHMHLRGKDMTFKAHYPNATSETLLMIPNYQFDWQTPYVWEFGKQRFPKGTRLECLAHYDNSAFNPYNPDPKATVRDGLQTHHEMMNGFFFYVRADEDLNLRIDPKTGRVQR